MSTTTTYLQAQAAMSDSNNNLISTTPINMALDLPANAPYVPSVAEAKHYLHGLPSNLTGRFIARSSPDVWTKPTGPEAYLEPKELSPLGTHQLNSIIWEHTVGPAMDAYLSKKLVQCTVLLPVRIGPVGKPSSPVIMVGVNHNTLSPTIGIDIAIGCRSILLRNGIDDMHIIIHESTFHYFASLYKPAITSNPTHLVREPFSTTLGIPICNAATPNIEGTGSFFFTDSANPNILYLLTARHVLFPPETSENKLYTYRKGNGQPKKQVMFMGEATFKNHCRDIELAIDGKNIIIAQLKRRLADADKLDDKEEAMEERKQAEDGIEMAKNAIEVFQKLLATIIRDWMLEENRVIGHIVLSPPIAPNYGKDGFTDDWAVIQINPSMIDRLNFIGNAIDLGSIAINTLTCWMYPHLANPHSFKYPGDRLLRFSGTVPNKEMFQPDPKTNDHNNDPAIMVLKNGNTSNLSVGRLNTIRAFTRRYFKGQADEMSKEVCVLPRNSKSGAFSCSGDSGSVVVDGQGRVCGIITGGDGATDSSDCTYVTSINFLIKRLADFNINADIFPSL